MLTVRPYYAPAHREGNIKHCFCLSVHPSVTYIANKWRTRRPSVPKFGMKVPNLWCDSHTSFTVKDQGHHSPGPLMLTHIVRHIFRMARPTNFKLGTRMEDCISHRRHDLQGQSSSRKVTWSVWAILAQCCTCVLRGRRGHIMSAEPSSHTSCCSCTTGETVW